MESRPLAELFRTGKLYLKIFHPTVIYPKFQIIKNFILQQARPSLPNLCWSWSLSSCTFSAYSFCVLPLSCPSPPPVTSAFPLLKLAFRTCSLTDGNMRCPLLLYILSKSMLYEKKFI